MAGSGREGVTTALAELHRELGIPADYCAARGWTACAEAPEADLVSIGADVFGRDQRLVAPAAEAWRAMAAAAGADSVVLQPVSAFRGVDYQAGIFRRKLAAGQTIADILAVNAVPGYSEHHSGRALDITTPGAPPLEESFETTAAFEWLSRHAGRYRFRLSYPRDNAYGIAYEPWHWAYTP